MVGWGQKPLGLGLLGLGSVGRVYAEVGVSTASQDYLKVILMLILVVGLIFACVKLGYYTIILLLIIRPLIILRYNMQKEMCIVAAPIVATTGAISKISMGLHAQSDELLSLPPGC